MAVFSFLFFFLFLSFPSPSPLPPPLIPLPSTPRTIIILLSQRRRRPAIIWLDNRLVLLLSCRFIYARGDIGNALR